LDRLFTLPPCADIADMRGAGIASVFQRPHSGLAFLGIVIVSLTSIVGSGFSLLALPFAVWSMLPYGALWLVGRALRDRWPVLGAGTAALAADIGIRAAVFLWPRGSTAAIALVFSPAYITAIVMPVGAGIGWLLGKMWRWHTAGRVVAIVVSPTALALLMLWLARPELFPTTMLARRATLERIGPPRVVAGSDSFASIPVSTKAAWYLAHDLDGRPGEELAIVDHSGADVLDSGTLAVQRHVPFTAQPGRLWGSFSTLVRLPDDRLVVVQAGGGFSRTRLQDLNGTELWEYRPNPTTSPDALRPANLDRDGSVEFYASSTDFVARLDTNGRDVWRRPASLAALLATLPRNDESPAWIVAVEYGRRMLVWDENGRSLIERAVSADDSPVAVADTFAGRAVIHGGSSARAYDPGGTLLFDVALGEFTLSQAAGARLVADRAPYLALVGATDRDTSRYRLAIVDAERRIVYDEIFDRYPRVVTARRGDGSDALFINDSQGLRLLSPGTR
jgi:hypothetical protein